MINRISNFNPPDAVICIVMVGIVYSTSPNFCPLHTSPNLSPFYLSLIETQIMTSLSINKKLKSNTYVWIFFIDRNRIFSPLSIITTWVVCKKILINFNFRLSVIFLKNHKSCQIVCHASPELDHSKLICIDSHSSFARLNSWHWQYRYFVLPSKQIIQY